MLEHVGAHTEGDLHYTTLSSLGALPTPRVPCFDGCFLEVELGASQRSADFGEVHPVLLACIFCHMFGWAAVL